MSNGVGRKMEKITQSRVFIKKVLCNFYIQSASSPRKLTNNFKGQIYQGDILFP